MIPLSWRSFVPFVFSPFFWIEHHSLGEHFLFLYGISGLLTVIGICSVILTTPLRWTYSLGLLS